LVERFEIRLSGSGGQGLVLAGVILAEAAAIHDNLYAVQSQSYGPEARGGASKSEVIIGSEPISYPKATSPDLLLALNQESFNKYAPSVNAGGLVIVDADYVEDKLKGSYRLISLPMSDLARTQLGREMVVNILCLGVIQELTGVVSREALEKAVMHRVPRGTEHINMKAFALGVETARKYKEEHPNG
jgi:2-oxoglutarate ferredoxin oxidoreductase subunit gamma